MPRGLRSRLTIVTTAWAFVGLAVLVVGFNLQLRSNLDADADRVLRSAADSGSETVEVKPDGTFKLLEPPGAEEGGAQVWIYDGEKAVQRPRQPAAVQALADDLAGTDGSFAESVQYDTRLYSQALDADSGGQVGTVVSALSVEPYERSAKSALIASLIFAAVVLVAMFAIVRIVLARALRPVSRMTREATDWSEHDLDHRFGAGEPYDELTGLAAAFDAMLDRLASTLRHEQNLSAEISHELRTPLAAVLAETDLALRDGATPSEQRDALLRIQERASKLATILDTLMVAARAELDPTSATADVAAVVERVRAESEEIAADCGVDIEVETTSASAAVDGDLLARMLAPLVENGCRYGRSAVRVSSAAVEGGRLRITVTDDGPGIDPREIEQIFEPGARGSAAAGSVGGSGLGLALVRRLARSAGGSVEAVHSGEGGRFLLDLPGSSLA